MSAGSPEPFDNDMAADFKAAVASCPTTEARTGLLMATMGAVLDDGYDPGDLLEEGYEFPAEIEGAIASAAFVADTRNDEHRFTDRGEAMVFVGDDPADPKAWKHIEFEFPPRQSLVERAGLTMEKVLRLFREAGISEEWQQGAQGVLDALKK